MRLYHTFPSKFAYDLQHLPVMLIQLSELINYRNTMVLLIVSVYALRIIEQGLDLKLSLQ